MTTPTTFHRLACDGAHLSWTTPAADRDAIEITPTNQGFKLSLADHICWVATPIELCFTQTPTHDPIFFEICLGRNARLTLLQHHEAATPPVTMKVSLAEQAKLVHARTTEDGIKLERNVHLAKGAFYDLFELITGPGLHERDLRLTLQDEMAQARTQTALLLRDNAKATLHQHIAHQAPSCESEQKTKAVLSDTAQASVTTRTYVAPHAQKTDAHQHCQALLLSDRASMTAKPELEILADDVKCGHGCAIGDLDETALFYLRSRGIPAPEARRLLIGAFFEDLFDTLTDPTLKQALMTRLDACFSQR